MYLLTTILTVCSLNINTLQVNRQHHNFLQEKSALSSVHYTPPPKGEDFSGDIYENNNNYEDATRLSPDNYYDLDSYETNLEANVNSSSFRDIDYYYFTALTDTEVDISFTLKSYNFKLSWALSTNFYTGNSNTINRLINNIYEEQNVSSQSKSFLLKPGTYYLYLTVGTHSPTDYKFEYNLRLNAKKSIKGYENENIGTLKYGKGLGGVVWKSDYQVLPEHLSTNVLGTYKYYDRFVQGIHNPDPALDTLNKLYNQQPILLKEYFIWDKDIKEAIHTVANEAKTLINEKITNKEIKQVQIKTAINTAENAVEIGIEVIKIGAQYALPEYKKIIKVSADILKKISEFVFSQILNTLLERPDVKVVPEEYNYLTYLNGIVNAFQTEDEDNRVLSLPIYYNLYNEQSFIYKISYISLYPTVKKTISSSGRIYYDQDIFAEPNGSFPTRGKIYGLDDQTRLVQDYPFKEDQITDIFVNEPQSIPPLHKQEFLWFKFRAPKNSIYSFYTNDRNDISTKVYPFTKMMFYSEPDWGNSGKNLIGEANNVFIDSKGDATGSFYQETFTENQIVYIRIESKYTGSSVLMIEEGKKEFSVHQHNFSSKYKWLSELRHVSICECGTTGTEGPHVVTKVSGPFINNNFQLYCSICGGIAKYGIIGNSLLSASSRGKDLIKFIKAPDGNFYINESKEINGIIFLDYEDSLLLEIK